MESPAGSWPLFRLFGITVFVHWSWLPAFAYYVHIRMRYFPSLFWSAMVCLTVFAIVLLHEFGHALATLSVKGEAKTIVLWPLGGVAYVNPPHRPGAVLWSIFAGPLVNIILAPILLFAALYVHEFAPDTSLARYFWEIFGANLILLIFNMLPIYPLDGGQILHALLWFAIGYARALRAVAVVGFFGAAGIIALAVTFGLGPLTYLMALFIGWRAYAGYQVAQEMIRRTEQPAPPPMPYVPPTPGQSITGIPPADPRSGGWTNSWDKPQQ